MRAQDRTDAQNRPQAPSEARSSPANDRHDPYGRPGWFPLTVTLVYAVLGALWILLSDRLVAQISPSFEALQLLQTYKGWFYISVTALLLYVALSAAERHLRREQEERESALTRLDLALRAAQGGIWERDLASGQLYISPHIKRALGLDPAAELDLKAWRKRIHPDDRADVHARMREFHRRGEEELSMCYRVRHANGNYCWLQVVGRQVSRGRGAPQCLLGVMIDVTELRQAEDNIERLIHYDSLTGLPNRRLFQTEFTRRIDALPEDGAILLARCDLDSFGEVNTEFGPEEGDKVLQAVAERLRRFAGANGFCGRIGGDEFALLLALPSLGPQTLRPVIDGLDGLLRSPFDIAGTKIDMAASIGVALAPQDGRTVDTLMANADVAVSAARRQGRGQTQFYAAGMNEAVRARRAMGRDLKDALKSESIEAHYQPIVKLPDRTIVGFEALVRWHHPTRGTVAPTEFIPVAEEQGLIGEIGNFMLRRACQETHAWQQATGRAFKVAVNLSPVDLERTDLAQSIASILEATGLRPDLLELEVTENAVMRDIDLAAATLSTLRALGVSIAIDDFGTGYSSLVALRRLPVSKLKIDRSFIAGYGSDSEDTTIVDSIIELAHSLGLLLTAEGVETEEQCALLCEHGCEQAQGFLFSRPVPPTRAWRLVTGEHAQTTASIKADTPVLRRKAARR